MVLQTICSESLCSISYFGVSYLLFQVYLEARKQEQQKHQESLKMLSDEVSQIQEVSIYRTLPAAHTRMHTVALL